MKKAILITILDDVMNRLDEAIEATEKQLPDEMREEIKGILGNPETTYPIMEPFWVLSSSLDRMLTNLRED